MKSIGGYNLDYIKSLDYKVAKKLIDEMIDTNEIGTDDYDFWNNMLDMLILKMGE